MRYARQGTIGYDPRDVADIVVSPIEDVDEKLVMLLNAFDSEVGCSGAQHTIDRFVYVTCINLVSTK